MPQELPSYGPKRSRSVVQRLGHWLDGVLRDGAESVVSVPADILSRLVRRSRHRRLSVSVVTNGVEVERFVVPPQPAGWRGSDHVQRDARCAYQDIDLLLEAFVARMARAKRSAAGVLR